MVHIVFWFYGPSGLFHSFWTESIYFVYFSFDIFIFILFNNFYFIYLFLFLLFIYISCIYIYFVYFSFDIFIFILFNSFYFIFFYLFYIYIYIYIYLYIYISVYFIFIYAFSYCTISKFQSVHYSNLHFIISNSHNLSHQPCRLIRRLRRQCVGALTVTGVTVGVDVYGDPVYLFLHRDVSLWQYSCSISRPFLQQADHSRSPMFSMSYSMSVSALVFRKWRFLRPT